MLPTRPISLLLASLAISLGCLPACGGKAVRPLSIFDERLPPDSRRWVADADDQIIVARAWRDEMHAAYDETLRWKKQAVGRMQWEGSATSARKALGDLADKRLTIARLERERADTQYRLAISKWEQVMAETAMRHDIAIYELEPIEDAVKGHRTHVLELTKELETEKIALEKLEARWWEAFAAYVKGGGHGEVLWVHR